MVVKSLFLTVNFYLFSSARRNLLGLGGAGARLEVDLQYLTPMYPPKTHHKLLWPTLLELSICVNLTFYLAVVKVPR